MNSNTYAEALKKDNWAVCYKMRWSKEEFAANVVKLAECLVDGDDSIVFIVLTGVFKIGPMASELIEVISPIVGSQNPVLSRLAFQTLGNIGYKNVAAIRPNLLAALGSSSLREDTLRIIAHIGSELSDLEPRIRELLPTLKAKERRLAQKAIESIGKSSFK